jgi:hypothetical protein
VDHEEGVSVGGGLWIWVVDGYKFVGVVYSFVFVVYFAGCGFTGVGAFLADS